MRAKRHQLLMTEVENLKKIKHEEQSKLGDSNIDKLFAWDDKAFDETLPESESMSCFFLTLEPQKQMSKTLK